MNDVRGHMKGGTIVVEGGRDLLTVAETARELDLTIRGVQERLRRGRMQGERVSPRLWMVPRAEVDRWKQLGRQRPGRKPKVPATEQVRRDMAEHQDALDDVRRRIRGEGLDTEDENAKEQGT